MFPVSKPAGKRRISRFQTHHTKKEILKKLPGTDFFLTLVLSRCIINIFFLTCQVIVC